MDSEENESKETLAKNRANEGAAEQNQRKYRKKKKERYNIMKKTRIFICLNLNLS